MILQRDAPLSIWGWASPGEKVKVNFRNKNFNTTTGKDGKWKLQLPSQTHGGPFTMEVRGKNTILLKDILIGDVWFCSGQSNMVHQFKLHRDRYMQDISQANNPMIRQFVVPVSADLQKENEYSSVSYWKSAVKNDIENFSVVAYYFARSIFEKHKIPIGIINASVGGTPIESWMSETAIRDFSSKYQVLLQNRDSSYVNATNRIADSISSTRPNGSKDLGMLSSIKWYDTSLVTTGWQQIGVPGYWEDQGHKDLNGVVWYRRVIDLPAEATVSQAMLHLGRIVDADDVYVNGTHVGRTTYQYPQRRYVIAKGILKPGRNVIAVRVINYSGDGGFVPGKSCVLVTNNYAFTLKGDWEFKVGEIFMPYAGKMVNRINFANQPSALYNGMVNPFIQFAVKGFIWYQGESNADEPSEYRQLLKGLINNWRNRWKNGNAPFVYVQLPNFMERRYYPGESNWALLRDAQLNSLDVANTAMAITIDLGEWNDIHPGNKKDVGLRVGLAARKIAYGENEIISSGPVYQSHRVQNDRLIVRFSNIGSGLTLRNDEVITGFEIAGEDRKFYWAEAVVSNDEVILSSEKVAKPKYARYAWADNPFISLYNNEGLPASPFRTL
jgi:sialate O-acetylesterase